jgi:hypothetical protein
VVGVRVAGGVGGHLGAVDGHHRDRGDPGFDAEPEDLGEERPQGVLMTGAETGDRGVVGEPAGRDHPVGDEPGEVVLGEAVAQVGRQQQGFVTLAAEETPGHRPMPAGGADGAGVYATASRGGRKGGHVIATSAEDGRNRDLLRFFVTDD